MHASSPRVKRDGAREEAATPFGAQQLERLRRPPRRCSTRSMAAARGRRRPAMGRHQLRAQANVAPCRRRAQRLVGAHARLGLAQHRKQARGSRCVLFEEQASLRARASPPRRRRAAAVRARPGRSPPPALGDADRVGFVNTTRSVRHQSCRRWYLPLRNVLVGVAARHHHRLGARARECAVQHELRTTASDEWPAACQSRALAEVGVPNHRERMFASLKSRWSILAASGGTLASAASTTASRRRVETRRRGGDAHAYKDV